MVAMLTAVTVPTGSSVSVGWQIERCKQGNTV